MSTTLNG